MFRSGEHCATGGFKDAVGQPLSDVAYDPATLQTLGKAYDEALRELKALSLVAEPHEEAIRLRLAHRILRAAAHGERNPERLKLFALAAIKG